MSNKVICIIDDDPIYQLLTKKIIAIAKTDYSTISFKNGREALDYFIDLPENLPCIILLDIEMPIMDGWDFLNEIEKRNMAQTTIYLVTSSISHEDKEKTKCFSKISGFFSKPLDVDKILQITKER